MKNEPKSTTTTAIEANKKTWVTPTIEVVSKNIIQSGNTAHPTEGVFTLSSAVYHGDGNNS